MMRTTMSGMAIDANPLPIDTKPTTVPMPFVYQRFTRYVIDTMPPSPYARPKRTAPIRNDGKSTAWL